MANRKFSHLNPWQFKRAFKLTKAKAEAASAATEFETSQGAYVSLNIINKLIGGLGVGELAHQGVRAHPIYNHRFVFFIEQSSLRSKTVFFEPDGGWSISSFSDWMKHNKRKYAI